MKPLAMAFVFACSVVGTPALCGTMEPDVPKMKVEPSDKAEQGGLGPAALALLGGVIVALLTITYNIWATREADRSKEEDRKHTEEAQRNTLRSAIRSELAQLIDVLDTEVDMAKKPTQTWTWLPIHDFFGSYRRKIDLVGTLTPEEVDQLTAAVHTYAEIMGYVFRENSDFSADIFPTIGRNVRISYEDPDQKSAFIERLNYVRDVAQKAYDAITKELNSRRDGVKRPPKARLIGGAQAVMEGAAATKVEPSESSGPRTLELP